MTTSEKPPSTMVSETDIMDVPIEDLLRRANFQHCLLDLLSDDRKTRGIALQTLAGGLRLGGRRDCLYPLVGYYHVEVRDIQDLEFFFRSTRTAFSFELLLGMLDDLAQDKEASRHRILMKDFVDAARTVLLNATPEQRKIFREVVESAAWGSKQKVNFLNELDG